MSFRAPAPRAAFIIKYCNILLCDLGMLLTIHYLLKGRFPELLLSFGLLFPLLIWIGLYTFLLMWQQSRYPFKGQFWGRLLGSFLLLWLLRRLLWDKDAFSMNLRQVINTFLMRYNHRSGSNLAIRYGENPLLEYSILLYLYLLLMLTVLISMTLRNCKVFLVPPVVLLCIQLTVDKEPGIPGIFLLFLLSVLCMSDSHTAFSLPHRFLTMAMATVIVLTSLGLSNLWKKSFTDKATHVRDFQYKMETTLKNMPIGKGLMGAQHINNAAPEYTGRILFTITCPQTPVANLYLRDFYATDYWNGYWSRYNKGIEKACTQAGYDKEELRKTLAALPYENGTRIGISTGEYTIQYESSFGDAAHLPYGAFAEEDSGLSINADGLWNKSRLNKSLSFIAPYTNHALGPWGNSLQSRSSYVSPTIDWYNGYISSHILVNSEQTAAKDIAEYLKNLNPSYTVSPDTRLEIAQEVATYLKTNYRYDLNPGDVPSLEDNINYFLSVSKKGYCEHFASAGVFILRYLGVPCRYASGYIVQVSKYKNSSYSLPVPDSAAHAWVEIYLDNAGWIPVEMTPGYESIYTTDSIPEPNASDSEDKQKTPDPSAKDDQDPSQSESQPADPQEAPGAASQNPQNTDPNKPETSEPTYGYMKYLDHLYTLATSREDASNSEAPLTVTENLLYTAFSVLFLIPLGIALVILSVKGIRNLKLVPFIRREKRLQNCMHKGNYPAVIHFINRFYYLELLKKRVPFDKKKGDPSYFEALAGHYPNVDPSNWEHFRSVVTKCTYSVQDISAEEAQFCYYLYQDCFPLLYTGKSGQI